jgi:predicted PurR-regulated permease PerM
MDRDSLWRPIIVGALSIFFGLALLAAIYLMGRSLAFLVLAISLAAAVSPLVAFLARRLPYLASVLLVYLALLLLMVLLAWLIFPPIISQAVQLSLRAPEFLDRIEMWIEDLGVMPRSFSLLDTLATQGSRLAGEIIRWPLTIGSSLFELLLVVFVSLYASIEAPRIRRFIRSLFRPEQGAHVELVLSEMANSMGGYLRGAAINGVIIGVASWIGYAIIGLEYAPVLGMLAGVLEMLPVLGPILAGSVAIAIALVQSPQQALIVLIFVVLLQQVESNLLTPYVMRKQTKISPLLAIISIFAGGAIGGLLGAIIAIPVASALTVLVRLAIAPAIRKQNAVE